MTSPQQIAQGLTEADGDFVLKAFSVSVQGWQPYTYFARSRGRAMARAWDSYVSCYNKATFGDFLRLASCRRNEAPGGLFGKPITVGGKPAFFVSRDPQYVQFVRPGSDDIFHSHPFDVEPEEVRPSTYRSLLMQEKERP